MKTTVQGAEQAGAVEDTMTDEPLFQALVNDFAPMRPSRPEAFEAMAQGYRIDQVATSVGTPAGLLLELAGIKTAIRTFYLKEPDQVIRESSAYSARLTEVWTELRLLEPMNPQWAQMRTMQVTPLLEELDRQYKYATSRIAMQRQDIDMLKYGGA